MVDLYASVHAHQIFQTGGSIFPRLLEVFDGCAVRLGKARFNQLDAVVQWASLQEPVFAHQSIAQLLHS